LLRAVGHGSVSQSPVSKWQEVFRELPDALLIGQGGAYCGLGLRGLPEWLSQAGVPHYILCQSARSQWPLDEALRVSAQKYYSKGARVGFCSEGNRQEIRIQLADHLPNSVLFQNPIGFGPGNPVPWADSRVPLFSCPARFNVADKGQDLLLQVLTEPQWRAREFRFTLFGGGPDEAYFRRLVEFLGLGDQVVFGGETPGTRPIWQQTQLLIMPSRTEGLSLVLLEGMAAGRPAVVTTAGGHAEWLRDGHDGFVAPMPCVSALSVALERAWAARSRWPALGQSARARFLALYDPDPVASLLAVLEEIAGTRNTVATSVPAASAPPGAELTKRTVISAPGS
jgi:glycosyltransferase involved in cell wall biosynthesis